MDRRPLEFTEFNAVLGDLDCLRQAGYQKVGSWAGVCDSDDFAGICCFPSKIVDVNSHDTSQNQL